MSRKSSLPQLAKSVSQVLMADRQNSLDVVGGEGPAFGESSAIERYQQGEIDPIQWSANVYDELDERHDFEVVVRLFLRSCGFIASGVDPFGDQVDENGAAFGACTPLTGATACSIPAISSGLALNARTAG